MDVIYDGRPLAYEHGGMSGDEEKPWLTAGRSRPWAASVWVLLARVLPACRVSENSSRCRSGLIPTGRFQARPGAVAQRRRQRHRAPWNASYAVPRRHRRAFRRVNGDVHGDASAQGLGGLARVRSRRVREAARGSRGEGAQPLYGRRGPVTFLPVASCTHGMSSLTPTPCCAQR